MSNLFACVFPGQGSQSVGMLNELAEHYPAIRSIFKTAAEALGYDLWKLISEGPADTLNQTEFTQPALLAAGYSVWQISKEANVLSDPAYLAGHSLGEYTALVCAKALDFADALRLVKLRGQLMQQAVPQGEGAMAAIIGLTPEIITEICHNVSALGTVEPANFNAIGQIVIAGKAPAVNEAVNQAKAQGAKLAKLLPVSVPSHCSLMRDAAQSLAVALNNIEIAKPCIPVVHNVDTQVHEHPDDIRQALVEQLYMPVQWVNTVQFFAAQGVKHVAELGPGKVLQGLIKRIDPELNTIAVYDSASMNDLSMIKELTA